jgi:hypothetical protein
VSGRVVQPAGQEPAPVSGAWVVLHRIGHESSGPLDSVRTNARGAYTFDYPRAEEDSAIYLVSSMRGGVAYFSRPLRPGHVTGDAAEIMVFDTTSAEVHQHVQGRHLVVARGEEGANLQVLEVYELSNDTSVTAIAAPGGRAVWTAIVPEGASAFRVGQGDVSEGGLVMRDGRVHLYRNAGNPDELAFEPDEEIFADIRVSRRSAPAFVDVEGNGTMSQPRKALTSYAATSRSASLSSPADPPTCLPLDSDRTTAHFAVAV